MRAVWFGAAPTPTSNVSTRYTNIVNILSTTWQNNEDTHGFGQSCIAMSDSCVITKFTVHITTPPGSGNSWEFKIRQNRADSGTAVTIADTETTATWEGSLPVAELDKLSMSCTPVSGPDAAGAVYWVIEYQTPGNYYLMPSIIKGIQNLTTYAGPIGGINNASLSPSDYEMVVPTGITVTRIAASLTLAPGTGKSYTFAAYKNATTESSFTATISDSETAGISSVGSQAFAAGDTIAIKTASANNPLWLHPQICLTVVPDNDGEIMQGFGSPATLSTSVMTYESPQGAGYGITAGEWDTTESNVLMRVPACTLKKLYVAVNTAPGSGKDRMFALRSNGGDVAHCTVADAATTASDTSNISVHADGDFISVKSAPSNSPASTAARFGFVIVLSQPSTQESWFSSFA